MGLLIPIIILLFNNSLDIRLRDMSQETHQEHRKRISEMEKDIATVDRLEGLLDFFSDSLCKVMPSIFKSILRRKSYQTCQCRNRN